jgi:uncharacterized cupredoxin-like copper-binding protein
MKKYGIVVLLAAFAIILAGCSGGGQSASNNIKVTLTDFSFNPNNFTVPAGQEISFSGRNNGAVMHDFIIMKLGANVGDTYGPEDEPDIFWKTELQPGQTSEGSFIAPSDPGEYQILCGIPGHLQAGMIGTLTVTP